MENFNQRESVAVKNTGVKKDLKYEPVYITDFCGIQVIQVGLCRWNITRPHLDGEFSLFFCELANLHLYSSEF